MKILTYILIGVISYLIGCFNFAKLISKQFLHDDISNHGSGNPGTTNMYRTFGLKVAIVNLIFDILKGVLPTLIVLLVFGRTQAFVAGACAILGHIFPVFYKFRGGKGVATTIGFFLVVNPIYALCTLVVMLALIYFFEYMAPVSLAAISFWVCVQCYYMAGNVIAICCLIVILVLVWFAHRRNIVRLVTGKENKVILNPKHRRKLKLELQAKETKEKKEQEKAILEEKKRKRELRESLKSKNK